MRHGRDRRGRPPRRVASRQGTPAVGGVRVPEGHRLHRGAERPGPRHDTRCAAVRTDSNRSRGTTAMSDIAARLSAVLRRARFRWRRLVHGQPRRVQLRAHLRGAAVHQGPRTSRPLLHRLVAGHQQQADREPVALRRADVGADPRSDAHRTPGDDGRQSGCLPRQFPDRAPDQGPHAGHRQAWRPGGGRRSPPHRDRRRIRMARHRSRLGFLPAAVAAAGDVLRAPRRCRRG